MRAIATGAVIHGTEVEADTQWTFRAEVRRKPAQFLRTRALNVQVCEPPPQRFTEGVESVTAATSASLVTAISALP